ncbi:MULTISPECIES: FecR family protein [unclassified Bacteroides]|jgi:ferric-dicitrate binding protein FerR (iron transport regulator)|uniref:FecR family protein n=1 Tax=unclassified Bacteroides TaxID=2646097 RepID=UPI002A7FB474|nr:FecR domain-containing protein [Bacteroides sp.]
MKNYFQKILSLFARHNYSEQTNQMFYRWLVNDEYEKEKDEALQEFYSEARKKGKIFDVEESLERWRSDNNLAHVKPQQKSDNNLFMRWWQSVAIVLLIVSISLGYLLCKSEKDDSGIIQQCISGTQMKTFFLPDGSRVSMNSSSMLLYPEHFTGKYRSVFLIGEANFKVKTNKEKPFIVKTNDFQVTALGTEFNVSAYTSDENIFTTLITGSVLVEFADLTKKILLKPNEQLGYNRKSRQDTLTYPDMKDVTAWQKGGLVFNRKTITEIITILERKYDCKFFYNQHSLKNDRYSFRFKDNPPLSEVMDVIVDVAGDLYFKIEHDKCYIMQK